MKSSLLKCLLFSLPVIAVIVITGFLADGYTDPFYLRFTSPQQTSLIIGTSRAANGLHPDVLNRELAGAYGNINLYNFSFTLEDSPFGPTYLDAIKKKVKENTTKGVFIITVDPWSVSSRKVEGDDESKFLEKQKRIGKTKWVNMDPNFFYLLNAYNAPYLTILTKKARTTFFKTSTQTLLHNDGWLEVNLPIDSLSKVQWRQANVDIYQNTYLTTYTHSATRQLYLTRTIEFLQQHGDVYLVRLPVHPDLCRIDDTFFPGFDVLMDSLSKKYKAPYINFAKDGARYTYRDGIHVEKASGVQLSGELGNAMIRNKPKR